MHKRFFVMRHGETVANVARRAAGVVETPLTALGIEQAETARAAIEQQLQGAFDHIVHSTLLRAHNTALIVNTNLCLPMHPLALLVEQSFGDWAGRPWDDVRADMEAGIEPPNGETRDAFFARIKDAIEQACNVAEGTPLLVAHGRVLEGVWNACSLPRDKVPNCCVYEFIPPETSGGVWQSIRRV